MATDLFIVGSSLMWVMLGNPYMAIVMIMLTFFGYIAEADKGIVLMAAWIITIGMRFLKASGSWR